MLTKLPLSQILLKRIKLNSQMRSSLGAGTEFVTIREVNVLSVVMIDACGAGLLIFKKDGNQSMQPVDVTHMRLHTATPREIRNCVEDVITLRLQIVTGAGHGMIKLSGNQKKLLSDANLQRFE